MTAEVGQYWFIRCDGVDRDEEAGRDVRCFMDLGNPSWAFTEGVLDLLIRKARDDGWTVTKTGGGLEGIRVAALCPDHSGASPAPEALAVDSPSG